MIKLHKGDYPRGTKGDAFYINKDDVSSITYNRITDANACVRMKNGDIYDTHERPDQIIKLLTSNADKGRDE